MSAAMQALANVGPHASLDCIAALARCPKASLARIFSTKEALLLLAFQEIDRLTLLALRQAAQSAGGGRAGALGAARAQISPAAEPGFKGCPMTAACAQIALCSWASGAIIEHKRRELSFYTEILEPDIGSARAAQCAQAIIFMVNGIHINALSGFAQADHGSGLEALRAMIERA